VNTDADIQKTLETVLLFPVDAEKGEGIDLSKQFNVKGYPTFVLATNDGQTIDRWMGYAKDYFIETMASATADLATIETKQARFQSSPSAATAEALGRYHSATENYKDAVGFYKQAQALSERVDSDKTDSKSDYSFDIFDNMAEGANDDLFAYEEIGQAADVAITTAKDSPNKVVNVASRMAQMAAKHKQPDDVAKYLQAGLDATAGKDDANLKRSHASLMVDFSLMVKNDTATAVEYKKATMPEGWATDPDQLNNFAWWCFENNANLDEAERLSRKSVELAKPGANRANNLDTLAEIMHARGNTREAIEVSKKAARENPDSKYFPKQVERFEKLLKENQKS
jgi:tetratricopeptide (TPR) repeat protein